MAPTPPPPPTRLVSLDALRGFDMLWILGGDAVIRAAAKTWDIAPLRVAAEQVRHKEWAGFAFYDLIFPLFVFMVGTSLVFSLTRLLAQEGRPAAVKRVLRRAALLFVLGIFYSGGLSAEWPGVRLLGVLQRIALAYAAAGLLFCYFKPRALAICGGLTLLGYWGLMASVPIRDVTLSRAAMAARFDGHEPTERQARELYEQTTARVTGRYDPGLNVSNHFDFQHLPGKKYDGFWDPEGLLSTLPAVATCLFGVFAGLLLQRPDRTGQQKILWLVAAGVGAVALGWLWHLQFPVVKKIWTSSFVLVAGGWSCLLLAAFYYIVDVRRWRRWCEPLVWIGMNPITLYLGANILGFQRLAPRLTGGSVKNFLDGVAPGFGELALAFTALALMLALARFLYRRQIFLRF
jgi:predicted acyltransferase